jgi:Mg-chelatase subunit ChlD
MFFSFVYPNLLWLLLLVPLTAGLALAGRRRPTAGRFWTGLALRALLLAAIVLALAGIQLRTRADTLTAVFALDVSDSIPPDEQDQGEALIREAIAAMPSGDRAAVVVFGQDALVERIASGDPNLPRFGSVPVTARTDIASALQLAMALFPDEGAKRLVLLSDGRENLERAVAQAELAAAHQVELVYVPLGGVEGEVEVLIEALDAPADVRQGQQFDLNVVVRSTAQTGATLRVLGDGQVVDSREVLLQPGVNRFRIPVDAAEPGFRRFRAQVIPDADTRLQNNEASAFTMVQGPPRVLLVEGQPGEGVPLARALRAAEMGVTLILPSDFPTTLPELTTYEAVILANVPAAALPPGVMDTLQVYVRDLGKGLLMTGGETAFGAGGYLRTPIEETLPLDMDVRTKEQSPNLALVLVVDKSGSMGRCHCDNPDALPGQYVAVESGQPKVDIAKEAVMRAAGALGPRDYLGVVAFDAAAGWAVPLSPLIDPLSLEQALGSIPAEGRTNLRAGVEVAYEALQGVEARFKHIILLTDGWVREGELTPLATEMRDHGITLSVVAAGEGSARYLADLAEVGGGRYYPAVDILRVPDFFLQETVKAVGQYIVEEPFYPLPEMPSPVLRDLDAAALPMLRGYNGTSPKGTARVILGTLRGDPLLATWQYGLGKAAAWTSDLKAQWATEWVTWDGFARFAPQLVGWLLPAPQIEGISARATLEGDQAVIRVEAADESGRPRNFAQVDATLIGPDLARVELDLAQVGAGTYEARADLVEQGTYLVRVGVADDQGTLGQQTMGLVVPYSPEYRSSGADRTFLDELARVTGGSQLLEPVAAFLHTLPAADRAQEIWRALLLFVACLFPLDVAVRRVMLGPRDLRKALAWVRERVPARRRRAAGEPRVLGQLFQARDRGRARSERLTTPPDQSAPARAERAEPAEPPPQDGEAGQTDAPPPAGDKGDAFARLRQAKKRARR